MSQVAPAPAPMDADPDLVEARNPSQRICYLASDPVPSEAANSVHVAHMCDALGMGYTVTLMAPTSQFQRAGDLGELQKDYGVRGTFDLAPILQLDIRGGDWLRRRLLRFALWRIKPDLVYGRHLNNCLVAAKCGYRTVFEAHTFTRDREPRFQNDFDVLTRQSAFQALVVISTALSDAFIKEYPDLKGRIIVAPDAAPEWPQPAAKYEVHHNSLQVMYVGSLYPGKGMELLVKLAPLCPWARFTVVGGTENEIDGWRSALLEGTESFTFLGRIPHAEVHQQMTSADVLVAPYQYKVQVHGGGGDVAQWMSPLKLFEYMAAARPIVASNLPVIQEILEHERNALLADPENPAAWGLALKKIHNSPELGQRLANTAYDEYKQHYTWRARVDKIMATLRDIRT